jgi:hypothetical protein
MAREAAQGIAADSPTSRLRGDAPKPKKYRRNHTKGSYSRVCQPPLPNPKALREKTASGTLPRSGL